MTLLTVLPVRRLGGSLLANIDLLGDLRCDHSVVMLGSADNARAAKVVCPWLDTTAHTFLETDLPASDSIWPSELIRRISDTVGLACADKPITAILLAHDGLAGLAPFLRRRANAPKQAMFLHGTPSHSLNELAPEVQRYWLDGVNSSDLLLTVSSHLVPPTITAPVILVPHRWPQVESVIQDKYIDVLHVSSGRPVKRPGDVMSIFKQLVAGGKRVSTVITDPVVKLVFDRSDIPTVGLQEPSALLERMGRTKVLFLPSRAEGFPRVVLEALACGALPVLSDAANRSNCVQHEVNGFVFPVGDLSAAYQSVITALDFKGTVQNSVEHREKLEAVRRVSLEAIKSWSEGGQFAI